MKVFKNYESVNGQIIDATWIEWIHDDIPNSPDVIRWAVRIVYLIFGHCLNCSTLSGCYFVKTNMPGNINSNNGLLHANCHCYVNEIEKYNVKSEISAVCPLEKFTNYIFSDKYIQNGKKKLFEYLGFNIDDSYFLKTEFEKQAEEKYLNGEYTLAKLDIFGQNINIKIVIKNKNGRSVEFLSGWKVYPQGLLNCNTPMGDK